MSSFIEKSRLTVDGIEDSFPPTGKKDAAGNLPTAFFFQLKERLKPIKPTLPRTLDLLTGFL